MTRSSDHLVRCVLALAAFAFAPAAAEAGTIFTATGTSGGKAVSATADVTYADDFVTIKLTNTTTTTYDAAQLLTAFRFSFVSVAGAVSLDSAFTPNARSVNNGGSGGTFSDSAGPVSLAGTWQLLHPSYYELNFNPNAEYAILGAPNGSTGKYSDANGSIRGNPGHNPFSNGSATFVLKNNGFDRNTRITNVTFLFGTDFGGRATPQLEIVPLPPAVFGGLGLLGAMGVVRGLRRRRTKV